MKFSELIVEVISLIQARGRTTFRALQLEFDLTDDLLAAVREEIRFVEPRISERDERGFEWTETNAMASRTTAAASPVTVRPDAAEFRQVSVMFCDLVDSTSLSSTVDPEVLETLLRDYHTVCLAAVERFGGHIAQYLGDGVLAYFGYPLAHEDDASRATQAALQIAADMLAPATISRPHVRIGIHTGPVLLTDVGAGARRESLALGETPNLAAKIQHRAPPGAVVVSSMTARMLAGRFELVPLGVDESVGGAQSLSLYRVTASIHGSAFEAAVSRGLTPIVGREHETGLVLERAARAQEGFGQVVLISGEPGIGKSRLVQCARDMPGTLHLEFRCSTHFQHTALYPVISFLTRTLQFTHGETAEAQFGRLAEFVREAGLPLAEALPLLAALLSLPLPDTYPLPSVTPAQLRQRTLQVLMDLHLNAAARKPLCVVWEDLHWADATTLELIGMLVDVCPTNRLLLLATFRPEFVPSWYAREHLATLALSRLRPEQVSAMVHRIARGKSIPLEVLEQILLKTDGVPLFVEELTKMIFESGLVRETPTHFELAGPLPPLAIPGTLQESLQARLDRQGSARETAQIGAVLGREFSHELLLAVTGLDPTALEDALQRLLAAELIHRRGRATNRQYVFKHALIQDAAYQSLLKSRRQVLHRRVVDVLQEKFPELVAPQPQLLAHHMTEAGQLAEAIPVWLAAGQRAFERTANLEAIGHFQKGLEINSSLEGSGDGVQRELALLMAIAPAQMATTGYASDAVGATYRRVRDITSLLPEAVDRFPLLYGLWLYYSNVPDYPTALSLAQQLGELGFDSPDTGHRVLAHQARGVLDGWMGNFCESERQLRYVRHHYEAAQHHQLTFQYGGLDPGTFGTIHLAMAQWFLGFPDQALASAHAAIAISESVAHPVSFTHVLVVTGWISLLRGDRSAAREYLVRARTLATEIHADFWVGWADSFLGAVSEDPALLRSGIAALETRGVRLGKPMHLAFLAEVHLKQRAFELAECALDDAMQLAERGEKMSYAELHRLRGEVVLARDCNLDGAAELFERAMRIAREQQTKSYELRAAMSFARVCRSKGIARDAAMRLRKVYEGFTEGFETADLLAAKALLSDLGSD